MEEKTKIAIVGVSIGASKLDYTKKIIAAMKAHNVAIVEVTDGLKEAVEQFNQASLASENLKKALADLKELAPKLLAHKDTPSLNKPFYYNVPKYRRSNRR